MSETAPTDSASRLHGIRHRLASISEQGSPDRFIALRLDDALWLAGLAAARLAEEDAAKPAPCNHRWAGHGTCVRDDEVAQQCVICKAIRYVSPETLDAEDRAKPAPDGEAIRKRVAEIRERAGKATPGPWERDGVGTVGHIKSIQNPGKDTPTVAHYDVWSRIAGPEVAEKLGHGPKQEAADGDFIAYARTDVPALCDTIDALLAERDRLTAEVQRGKLAIAVANALIEEHRLVASDQNSDIAAAMNAARQTKALLEAYRVAASPPAGAEEPKP